MDRRGGRAEELRRWAPPLPQGEGESLFGVLGEFPKPFRALAKFPLALGGWGAYLRSPRSNARASGPSGYATTSSVLAIVLVAGSFDRFVNSARRLVQAGVQQRGMVR